MSKRFENFAIIHGTRYRNSRRIDLRIGIKAGQPCTHRITSREKFRERKAIFRHIEFVKARRWKVRGRKSLRGGAEINPKYGALFAR